jgi:signal transduction histidine kinase
MIMGIKLLINMPTHVGFVLHEVSDLSDLWVKGGPFRNGDQYEGSGIGLSFCAKVIARHGGRLWVESTLGCGAHFKFTLGAPESPL